MKSITVGITGQQGDRSNARKLLHWLRHWYENHSGKKKLTKPSECNMHRNLIAAIYRFPLHYVEFHFYFIFFFAIKVPGQPMMMAPILKPHYSLAHPESVSDAML